MSNYRHSGKQTSTFERGIACFEGKLFKAIKMATKNPPPPTPLADARALIMIVMRPTTPSVYQVNGNKFLWEQWVLLSMQTKSKIPHSESNEELVTQDQDRELKSKLHLEYIPLWQIQIESSVPILFLQINGDPQVNSAVEILQNISP